MTDPASLSTAAAALLTSISPEGRLLGVAPGLCRALGVSAQELVGKGLLSLVPQEEQGPVLATLRGLKPGEPATFEARMGFGGAAPRWFSWEVVLAAAGGMILGTARDIDAERAEARAHALLQAIGDALPVGIACSDEGGRFRYVNRAYSDHYGFSREAMLGMPFTMIIQEAQRERWMEWHRRVIGGATEPDREAPVVNRQGQKSHVRATAARVSLPGGQRFRLTTITDVTERRKAQQSEQVLRSILASAPMVIWAADTQRKLTLLEGRGLLDRGIHGEALLGQPLELLHGSAEVRAAIERAYACEEVSGRFELVGRVFDVCLVPLAGVERGAGEPVQADVVLGVEWDVTEEVRAAEELAAQLALVASQRETIRRLGMPVVPVGEGELCVPLVGEIDQERARGLLEDLLARIVKDGAHRALIDLTGVEGADVATLAHLVKVARAARLLGAEVVLTGLQPAMARAIAESGVGQGGLKTRATLQEALGRRRGRQPSA
ncbi:PAS domain S-box protein [Chondromyces apiculatus]|uniref:RsbR, positive regulator of sigma-B n=1 Tax=Chondromyces apiculatus DSM 436 TaxID=1192034 RepID=A0A017TE02_9BACT|nr:PAS domain S-box protein [Chondromyces apiculatus]EYF06846.1 RsbR, positive regulator of sigma-B [Chondromyces apiculatus DSM 436]